MKKLKLCLGFTSIFLGFVLLLITFFVNTAQKEFFEKAKPTTATISDIQKDYKRVGSKRQHKHVGIAYVDYKTDLGAYQHIELPNYSPSMKVGDTIEIYYNPDDQTNINIKEKYPFILLGINVFTVIFFGMGAVGFLSYSKENSLSRLKETGIPVSCVVKEIVTDESFRVNDRFAKYLLCEDTNSDKTYQSGFNIESDFEEKHPVESMITVYLDPSDHDRYYVET